MKTKQIGNKLVLTWEKDDEIKAGETITIQLDEVKTAAEEQTGFKTVTEYNNTKKFYCPECNKWLPPYTQIEHKEHSKERLPIYSWRTCKHDYKLLQRMVRGFENGYTCKKCGNNVLARNKKHAQSIITI